MDSGFVKVWRSIEKWEWYNDPITKAVFLHFVIKANYKETRYRGHVIPRGSLVCGRKKLSKELGISERNVRTAITHLKSTSEIAIKTTNKFSVISVVNYNTYNNEDYKKTKKVTTQPTNNRPTSDQQLTTSKEGKERKEGKEYKNKHLDCVFLTDKEYTNLETQYGSLGLKERIEKLNNYIMSHGKKYKSHYHTILAWESKNNKKQEVINNWNSEEGRL